MEINSISKESVSRDITDALLPTQTARKFIDVLFHRTPLLNAIRTIKMESESMELPGLLDDDEGLRIVGVNDTVGVGSADSEDQTPYLRSLSAYKIPLKTWEFSLSRSVDQNLFKDNVEGALFPKKVAKFTSGRFSSDLEKSFMLSKDIDPSQNISATLSNAPSTAGTTFQVGATQPAGFPVAGNGKYGYLKITKGGVTELCNYTALVDNAGTWEFQGVTRAIIDPDSKVQSVAIDLAISDTIKWQRNHLYGRYDGFLELAQNSPVVALNSNSIDGGSINGGNISYDHIYNMMQVLDDRYDSSELAFVMSKFQAAKLRKYMLVTYGVKLTNEMEKGYRILEVPNFPNDTILYTHPKNLLMGIWDQIKYTHVTPQTSATLALKNQHLIIMRMRAGIAVERPDAIVYLSGLTTTV